MGRVGHQRSAEGLLRQAERLERWLIEKQAFFDKKKQESISTRNYIHNDVDKGDILFDSRGEGWFENMRVIASW